MPPSTPHDAILEALRYAVVATDTAGRITFANDAARRAFGLGHKRIIGAKVRSLLPSLGILIAQCLDSGAPCLGRHIFINHANFVGNITPINRAGRAIGAVCLTEIMQAYDLSSRTLQSHGFLKRQLDTLLEFSPYGLWICDGQGRVMNVSRAALDSIGVQARDIVGKPITCLVESGVIDRTLTPQIIATKRPMNMLLHVKKTDKYIMSIGTPALDEKGNIAFVVVFEHDITTLNHLREQLEQSRTVTEKIRDELTRLNLLELKKQAIVAESQEMRQALSAALKLARLEASNILILGESGTGKGLLAKFIHKNSPREKKPFIQINCAALPEGLLEAELFGYEKGAFTGASASGKAGLFELAQGGTLFLDEIGDLPLTLQAKLLKCLDDHEIRHVGGLKPIPIDCVIIAATNRDLKKLVQERRFRQDLFYRLNIFSIRIPPLRERPEDMFELANHFLTTYNRTYGLQRRFAPRVLTSLQAYGFPGNVRELQNMVKNAVVMSDGDELDDLLPEAVLAVDRALSGGSARVAGGERSLTDKVDRFEKELLCRSREACRSTREMAADLGISQSSVVRKLKKHRLIPPAAHP